MKDQDYLLESYQRRIRSNRRLIGVLLTTIAICVSLILSQYLVIREDLETNAREVLFNYSEKYRDLVIDSLRLMPDSSGFTKVKFMMVVPDHPILHFSEFAAEQLPNLLPYLAENLSSYKNELTDFLGFSIQAQVVPFLAMVAILLVLMGIWRNAFVIRGIRNRLIDGQMRGVRAITITSSILYERTPRGAPSGWSWTVIKSALLLLFLTVLTNLAAVSVHQIPPLQAVLYLEPLQTPEVGYFPAVEGVEVPFTFDAQMQPVTWENFLLFSLLNLVLVVGIAITLLIARRLPDSVVRTESRDDRSHPQASPTSPKAVGRASDTRSTDGGESSVHRDDVDSSSVSAPGYQSHGFRQFWLGDFLTAYGRSVLIMITLFPVGVFLAWLGFRVGYASGLSLAFYMVVSLGAAAVLMLLFIVIDQKLALITGAVLGAFTYKDAVLDSGWRVGMLSAVRSQYPDWCLWLAIAALVFAVGIFVDRYL